MKRRIIFTLCFEVFCFFSLSAKSTIEIHQSFSKDTVLYIFPTTETISSASINLSANGTSPKSFFRVVLTDYNGRKYLLAESYKEIAVKGSAVRTFADETVLLDNIIPVSIDVYVRDITLSIESVDIVSETQVTRRSREEELAIRRNRVQEKVNMINKYNNSHEKLWTAGVTDISLLPFEDKMRVLGFSPSDDTGGFEYYAGGIFEVGERDEYHSPKTKSCSFVDEFDWTNRHGKNWMTSIKGQGHSNYCVAFGAIACVEALVNLYYNQKIDLDLSEQELACCSPPGQYFNPYNRGLLQSWVCNYLKLNGVCEESAYPFFDDVTKDQCKSDTIHPLINVKSGGNNEIFHYNDTDYEDSVKYYLINYGPLLSGFYVSNDTTNNNSYRSHAMALVGYGTIHEGDTIREVIGNNEQYGSSTYTDYYIIPNGSPLIGKTFFKFKNSNNIRVGDDINGYMYLMFHYMEDTRSCLTVPIKFDYPFTIINCNTNLPVYSNSDVVCEDADGDGYYFWGLGPKPINCPAGVPDNPDGEDSDPSVGPMDDYGNLTVIANEIVISGLVEYNSVMNPSHNIRVVNGGQLKISNTTTLRSSAQITVENGGILTVDSGILNNARIILCSGSTLNVLNNGTINMASGEDFIAHAGTSLNINYGKIN